MASDLFCKMDLTGETPVVVAIEVSALEARSNQEDFPPASIATDNDYRAIGYWPLTGSAPAPGAWQRVTGPTARTPDAETETVVREYTVTDYTLAERKAAMKAQATAKFREMRDAGTKIILGGRTYQIATTNDAIVDLREALDNVQSSSPGSGVDVVTRAGDIITITRSRARAILAAVQAHVAACQGREAALIGLINSASTSSDMDAVDVDAGWPDLTHDVTAYLAFQSIKGDRAFEERERIKSVIADFPEGTADARALKAVLLDIAGII